LLLLINNVIKLNNNELRNYLKRVLSEPDEIRLLNETEVAALPLYIRKNYKFYNTELLGISMIFAQKLNHQDNMRLLNEHGLLYNIFKKPIVILLENITAYQRTRLLELKIPFIIPDKQLYLPFVALHFTEVKEVVRKERNNLSPASQCLLLFHLEVQRISNLNFQYINTLLPYTEMTISRAAKELESFGLATIVGKKDKYLVFEQRPMHLWESAQKYLISPIKTDFYLDTIPSGYRLFKTYDDALAEYSNLSPGSKPAYAIGPADFQKLKIENNGSWDYFEGKIRMERWIYPPEALSKTDIVDPLSLYLSMRKENDERVSMALDQLLNNMRW
jgi:hypothetical protein